jgi:iron complex transport system substrate-binding protein
VALPMRKTLKAHREGREVMAGSLIAGALSFGSVLSLPFALKELEADLVLALDGDPATKVASSVKAGLAP